MGFLQNLFSRKIITINDPDFGELKSFYKKGNEIGWRIELTFLGGDIEILIDGDKNGLSTKHKDILMKALLDEPQIESECKLGLKEQFTNAGLKFESINMHFDIRAIIVGDQGLEVSFEAKETPYSNFNVHIENNKQVGVSIDR